MALNFRLKEKVIGNVLRVIKGSIEVLSDTQFFLVRHHLRVAYIGACDALAANTVPIDERRTSQIYNGYALRLDVIAQELQLISSELPGFNTSVAASLDKATRCLRSTSTTLKTLKPEIPENQISQLKRTLAVLESLPVDDQADLEGVREKLNSLIARAA